MNNSKLQIAIDSLDSAVKGGTSEEMYNCACALDELFNSAVPDPFKDYESALIRFKMAEAMVSFFAAVGETSQAGTLRNQIVAHYQGIRKSVSVSML